MSLISKIRTIKLDWGVRLKYVVVSCILLDFIFKPEILTLSAPSKLILAKYSFPYYLSFEIKFFFLAKTIAFLALGWSSPILYFIPKIALNIVFEVIRNIAGLGDFLVKDCSLNLAAKKLITAFEIPVNTSLLLILETILGKHHIYFLMK